MTREVLAPVAFERKGGEGWERMRTTTVMVTVVLMREGDNWSSLAIRVYKRRRPSFRTLERAIKRYHMHTVVRACLTVVVVVKGKCIGLCQPQPNMAFGSNGHFDLFLHH